MSDRGRARSNSRDRFDSRDGGRDAGRDAGRDSGRDRGDTRAEPGKDATASLLVRNVSYRVRSDEIRRVFSRYGEIRDVYIPQVILLGSF